MAEVRLTFDDLDADALPGVCLKCGAPAVVRIDKTFSWQPSWVVLLIPAGVLPYLIASCFLTRRRRVSAPLCAAHKNHWLWRTVAPLGGVVVLAGVAAGFLFPVPFEYAVVLGALWFLVLAGWQTALVVLYATVISAVALSDRHLTLGNVSPDFIREYEDQAPAFGVNPSQRGAGEQRSPPVGRPRPGESLRIANGRHFDRRPTRLPPGSVT